MGQLSSAFLKFQPPQLNQLDKPFFFLSSTHPLAVHRKSV
jgi:hypothetical protein